MNGSNSLGETDSAPLAFCPECSAKLWWATKITPKDYYKKLIKVAEKYNLEKEAKGWKKNLENLNNE
jgi:hypothetical protein